MKSNPTQSDGIAEQEFRARLSSLTERRAVVENALSRADGYVAAAGRIDLQIAEFFSDYIGWELDHAEMAKDMLAANVMFSDDNRGPVNSTNAAANDRERERRFRFHVDHELTGSMELLEQAMRRAELDATWPTVPELRWSEIVFEEGYFRRGGRPVFSGGFNVMERSLLDSARYPDWAAKDRQLLISFLEKMQRIGVGILSTHVRVLDLIQTDGTVDATMVDSIAAEIEQFGRMGFKVDVLFGWHGEDHVVEQVWPGITEYYGNFIDIDIDHPSSKVMIERVMAVVMPVLRDLSAIISWDMANEPFFSPDLWSQHTLHKYHESLSRRYASVEDLNRAWQTGYAAFQEIPLPRETPRERCSPARWYDRISFHNERVASFFEYFQGQIRRYVPDAVIHVKGQDNSSLGPRSEAVSEGIDRELLTAFSNLQGVDTRPLPVTEPRMATQPTGDRAAATVAYDGSVYGFHWLGQSFLYDYLTSLEPRQNVVDFEYHAFSINAIRIPDLPRSHPRATLWLAHLHGLISNITWYWHRRYGPCPVPSDRYAMWFYGSISTQPLVAAEYFHTLLKLNLFAEEVEALAGATPRPVRILVSKPSYIQNQAHINALHRVYEGSCFHGLHVGFVTEQMLARDGAPDGCRLILIPDAEFVSAEAVTALRAASEAGVQLVQFGDKRIRTDQHGLPHASASIDFLEAAPGIAYETASNLHRILRDHILPFMTHLQVTVDAQDGSGSFGIMHRQTEVRGKLHVLLVNVLPGPVQIRLTTKDGRPIEGCDLLEQETVHGDRVDLPFQGVRLIRVSSV
jgi:hypothetical protein